MGIPDREEGEKRVETYLKKEWQNFSNLRKKMDIYIQKTSSVQLSSVAQSCSTLCNPMDYSPPGSSVHGILQEKILEWVTIPFSKNIERWT